MIILVVLAQTHRTGLTLSKLKSITQLKSAYVERNLEVLVRLGWVEEIAFFGGRRFRPKADNPIVEELINFLKHVGCA